MKISNQEYTIITAEDGYFLTNNNGLYGVSIILGDGDSAENYTELPMSEWPNVDINGETGSDAPMTEKQLLENKKNQKLFYIDSYDKSNHVNGFYYNNQFMWLNRETRASLKNTIESLSLMNRNSLNIWYGNTYITLDLNSARMLLAALEVYATDCYNVTAMHKATIMSMNNIEDVENYNITSDYPQMLHFGETTNTIN